MPIVKNIYKSTARPRILLAPLDWGLGHATRCIPLIRLLLSHQAEVLIAAEGAAATLFKTEFPGIVILPLKGYHITYSNHKNAFFLKMFIQLPKILEAIRHEKKWLEATLGPNRIDAVISDNRYGFCSKMVPGVFITHQLHIRSGYRLLDSIIQKINYRFISRFGECWVPDSGTSDNLAGALSHPDHLPSVPLKYIGLMSRFEKKPVTTTYDLAVLLSGPEPQRTLFEKILLEQLQMVSGKVMLVRGLPGDIEKPLIPSPPGITIHNHLPAAALNDVLLQSDMVIARSGYSTIMDLVAIGKKAILVPTPGQTEQEYLASYLSDKKIFCAFSQDGFSLQDALRTAAAFPFASPGEYTFNEDAVVDWLNRLKYT